MLRIKVELVPHGVESRAETLDEILIANDGTGHATGPDEGGYGNYDVFDGETLEHLNVVDYPSTYACGQVRGVTRTPKHRLFLAEQALGVVQEARAAAEGLDPHGPNPPKVIREFDGHEP